ncbi:MAG: hypothetical protein JSU70_23570 [Phycisphaerales bacterium]|nr:MAG: hypothetical protein JSU70_23570 [Phycisphaerales bacterium]
MRLLSHKAVVVLLGLLPVLANSCAAAGEKPGASRTKPSAVERNSKRPAVQTVADSSITVAEIHDYKITRDELEEQLIRELRPDPYKESLEQSVDADAVLRKMVAEKAIVIEARAQGLHKAEDIVRSVKRFADRKLVNQLLMTQLQDKVRVTESEIKEKMKSDPKLDRAKAQGLLQKEKTRTVVEGYFAELCEKFHLKKLESNFATTAQIHARLLYRPKQERKVGWIQAKQVKDELTSQEKSIVLATFDNGKVTLEDWFEAVCEIVPPSRPRDLSTPKGVGTLLDRALKMPIFIAEAKLRGLDKDKALVKQTRELEDRYVLAKAKSEKTQSDEEPTEEQIIDYFNKNKEAFGISATVKIDQIWCKNLDSAKKAKAELEDGKDFESVRQKYCLHKKGRPFNTSPNSEGMFWEDLWKGKPNEIVGPLKGFSPEGVNWRIVKILEKKLGETKEYSADMNNNIKRKLQAHQRDAILAKYREELLEKYEHKIYADRIKDVDPLNIP